MENPTQRHVACCRLCEVFLVRACETRIFRRPRREKTCQRCYSDRAAANIEQLSGSDRVAYEYALKRYRDYYGGIMTAEEKGREEGKRDVARNMLANGLARELIASSTGLSLAEIDSL